MDKVNEQALKDLAKYKSDGCHMLVPCMDQIAEVAAGFRLIVTQVFLRPHPKDKDVYPHDTTSYDAKANEWHRTAGQGEYQRKIDPQAELVRVSGQGLEKLAQHTALVWDKPHVMIDKEHKGRQLCELAGAVRMPDGFSFYRLADAYGMDLEIVQEQLESQYSKSKSKDFLVGRDLLQKKANQTKLCISGARNRIIRKILGVDGTYTVASLSKPFIAVRVIPWLDMSDEYTRRLVTEMNVKQMAITSLFGGQMPEQQRIEAPNDQPAISYEANIPADKCTGDADVIDAEEPPQGDKRYHLNSEDDVPFGLDNTPTAAESLRLDFENSDIPLQCKTLDLLCANKGKADYFQGWLTKLKAPNNTMETISAKKRLEIYDFLVALPDVEKGKVAA